MRKFLYLFLVIGLIGCDSATGISSQAQGTYELVAINGQPLPVTFDVDFGEDVFYEGTLEVFRNGTFRETIELEEIRSGSRRLITDQQQGTWTGGSRGSLQFRYESGGRLDADFDGRDITMFAEDEFGQELTIEYRRR